MSNLRIAVVGPGLIGKKHIELVKANPASSLAAIVAPNREKYAGLASALAVPLFPDVGSLLAAEQVDGVIVSSPNIWHVRQATECLGHRIPVLVEKPISHNYEEGKRLVDFSKSQDVPLLVGHHRAHSPIMRAARAIVDAGRLGSIVAVMGSALFYKPDDYFEAGPWRKEIGGGPILINLIHEIGNLRALCGDIEAVQAVSTSATRGFAVEDTAAMNIIFASGALGVFLLSDTAASAKSWEQTARENTAYPTYPDEDCYVISGTTGTLTIPTMRLKFYQSPDDRSWWKPFASEEFVIERDDPLKCQLANFLNVIKGREAPVVSGHDGLQNLRVVEAIFESIARKTIVTV